ncbi:hypothetical protein DENSPDRAFT_87290 [Dentipellis sp. KUC8613]|nr:hypothetical protein DENSPDRAFT_87290 [Dentipellis sp. KUC8613]
MADAHFGPCVGKPDASALTPRASFFLSLFLLTHPTLRLLPTSLSSPLFLSPIAAPLFILHGVSGAIAPLRLLALLAPAPPRAPPIPVSSPALCPLVRRSRAHAPSMHLSPVVACWPRARILVVPLPLIRACIFVSVPVLHHCILDVGMYHTIILFSYVCPLHLGCLLFVCCLSLLVSLIDINMKSTDYSLPCEDVVGLCLGFR